MKSVLVALSLATTLLVGAGAAEARGCIKGAIVGGLAGHFAHHGLMGAAAGCAVGHHLAHRHDAQRTPTTRY